MKIFFQSIMLFSSISFLFYFLPIFLILYFIVPKKYKNYLILIFSLFFYFMGEPIYIIVLVFSCFINYFLSKLIERKEGNFYLILGLIYNIGQLLIFKYTDFFISNINMIFNIEIPYTYITMPIGISFFTFQAISYLVDVYRKKHSSAKNLWDFMMYISMFPQLIAGPIVRYSDIALEIQNRKCSLDEFSNGIRRFVIGLAKKVLIANVLGEFVGSLTGESVLGSWLRTIGYTLQLYFDFSGYSDMAIGMGLMMGFHFLENFNYPLIANSITDFWRRWHISLSGWFRDYVYIPLGGNRVSRFKWLRNAFCVWLLTGFWHGASWNFILWGFYFFILLVIEKLFLKKYLDKSKIMCHIYTIILVFISFTIFSNTSFNDLVREISNMFGIGDIPFVTKEVIYYFRNYFILIVISIIGATPLLKKIVNNIMKSKYKTFLNILEPIFCMLLLVLSTAFLIDESFNPFLYFRF